MAGGQSAHVLLKDGFACLVTGIVLYISIQTTLNLLKVITVLLLEYPYI